MLVKVSMAKGMVGEDNAPERFEELYDTYFDECRSELGKQGFSKLFWHVVNSVMRPHVMVCEQEPKIGYKIWNMGSHGVGGAWFDFETGNRVWIRVGVVDSEKEGGFHE